MPPTPQGSLASEIRVQRISGCELVARVAKEIDIQHAGYPLEQGVTGV